jgi:16S rRNA (uracil1498-N3)-methyltransferase
MNILKLFMCVTSIMRLGVSRAASSLSKDLYKLPRIYLPEPDIRSGTVLTLNDEISRYLSAVLRMKAGDKLRVFNGLQGEFLAELSEASLSRKRTSTVTLVVLSLLRSNQQAIGAESSSGALPISLLCAPIKRPRMKVLVEKTTEIGVSSITPMITQRSVAVLDSAEELRGTVIEACEQSERLTIPDLLPAVDLGKVIKIRGDLLKTVSVDRLLICTERTLAAQSLQAALQRWKPLSGERLGIFVGPEGGFTDEEIRYFDEMEAKDTTGQRTCKVSLGGNILRSETAALFAISCAAAIYHSDMLRQR